MDRRRRSNNKQLRTANHWFSVSGGRLTACGAPGKKRFAEAEAMGVTQVVTLQKRSESQFPGVARWVGRAGAGVDAPDRAPAGSGGRLEEPGDLESILRLHEVVTLQERGESVLVHRSAGMHRTGVSADIVLRLAGLAPAEALAAVQQIRQVTYEELLKERRVAAADGGGGGGSGGGGGTKDRRRRLVDIAEDFVPSCQQAARRCKDG